MQQYELDAPEVLRDCIQGFWYREMDFGDTPSIFEVLPDGHAEIIFHFGSSCSLQVGSEFQLLPSPFIVGLLQKPAYFQAKERLQIIGIKCFPWAIYDLLKLPPVKSGIQHFAHPVAGLQIPLESLLTAGKIGEALLLLQNWFIDTHMTSDRPVLNKAGQTMMKTNGSLPVSSVAKAANATVRTLERMFKRAAGHTVKDISSLIRFEQARNQLWENPDISVSGLAYDLGYADQSHLNREFKRYSGLTAGAFAKQILAQRKELSDDFVAIVLSPQ